MQNNYPKISIITPNYNGVKYLEQTILSVLNQNYPNLEYIIIDGGSTDGSIDIIKRYEAKLSYWVSEPDNGLYDAIQKGFDKSTGEIMAWINSDDMYAEKAFFIVSEFFSKYKKINWLQGIPSCYDEQGRTISVGPFKRWSKYNYYTRDYKWIQQESIFWRRGLWEKAGKKIDVALKYAGDFELWLRFFRHDKLFVTHALLGGFRMRSKNQISLEHFDDYNDEVLKLIDHEVSCNLSSKERKILKKIEFYKKLSLKNKYLSYLSNFKLEKIYKKHYEFPPVIGFDRNKQTFVL